MIYKHENLNTLARHFDTIEDYRDNRGKLHRLTDIFIMTVYGSLWGYTDFTNMAEDLKYKESFFTELLGLPNGVPSHDTFSAVFSIIDPQEFLECFFSWMAGILKLRGKHVAIDGKAVRAACDKIHGKQAPCLVNAFVVEAGLCIGQIRVDEKTNEIKGIPEMLKWLDLEGAVVSIDAIGCQKEIAEQIINKGADFVFQVKGNQQLLYNDIFLEMQARIDEKRIYDERNKQRKEKGLSLLAPADNLLEVYQQQEGDHSRIERRTYYVLNDNACVNTEEWRYVKSVGLVWRERLVIKRDAYGEVVDECPSEEVALYVMSRMMGAEEFASYARGHWGIENSLHWVLDDFFREDRCTARSGHATENLALMRKVVYNLMKLDENTKGKSMKGKETYYRNNPDGIMKLLFEDLPSRY